MKCTGRNTQGPRKNRGSLDSHACTEGGEMGRQVGLDESDEHCTQKDDAEWGWSVHT